MKVRNITEIIIHTAATPNGKPFHAHDIDAWHRERGWSEIGYHWVIAIDGAIEAGRHPDRIGAHAEGHNKNSYGICMIGNDRFTRPQWDSLGLLVRKLNGEYPEARIIGHNDVTNKKTCPNFDVKKWWANGCIPDDKNIWRV